MIEANAPKTRRKTRPPSPPLEEPPDPLDPPEDRAPPPPPLPPPLLCTATPAAKKVFGGSVRRLNTRTFPGIRAIFRIVCGERRCPSNAYTVSPSVRASTVL